MLPYFFVNTPPLFYVTFVFTPSSNLRPLPLDPDEGFPRVYALPLLIKRFRQQQIRCKACCTTIYTLSKAFDDHLYINISPHHNFVLPFHPLKFLNFIWSCTSPTFDFTPPPVFIRGFTVLLKTERKHKPSDFRPNVFQDTVSWQQYRLLARLIRQQRPFDQVYSNSIIADI